MTQSAQHDGLTTKEIKTGENVKLALAIAFLLALIGAAIDILLF